MLLSTTLIRGVIVVLVADVIVAVTVSVVVDEVDDVKELEVRVLVTVAVVTVLVRVVAVVVVVLVPVEAVRVSVVCVLETGVVCDAVCVDERVERPVVGVVPVDVAEMVGRIVTDAVRVVRVRVSDDDVVIVDVVMVDAVTVEDVRVDVLHVLVVRVVDVVDDVVVDEVVVVVLDTIVIVVDVTEVAGLVVVTTVGKLEPSVGVGRGCVVSGSGVVEVKIEQALHAPGQRNDTFNDPPVPDSGAITDPQGFS